MEAAEFILKTQRLRLRQFSLDDADFMLRLLNEPGWLRFIGDRGVTNLVQAQNYLQNGALENYRRLGFGFYAILTNDSIVPIGMCGLTKRDYLDAPDLGFALLAQYEGQGLAFEAAAACLQFAQHELQLSRVLATTRLDNERSAKLLEKLGMRFKENILHPDGDRYLKLYEINF